MNRSCVLFAVLLFGCEPQAASHRTDAPDEGAAPPHARAPAQLLAPAYSRAVTMRDPPVAHAPGVADVVVRVPANFDATKPLHLVILFHGSGSCAAQVALAGEMVCKPGTPTQIGGAVALQHDTAGTQSVFIVPQFNLWGGGTSGKLVKPGYFKSMVTTIVEESLAPAIGKKTLDDVESITLVAHSAGWNPLSTALKVSDLEDKVRAVVMVDAMFGGPFASYADWVKRGKKGSRKFISVHGSWGGNDANAKSVAAAAKRAGLSTDVQSTRPLTEAIADNDVVTRLVRLEHAWMLPLTIGKIIAGLPIPRRPPWPPGEAVSAPKPTSLALGHEIQAALTPESPHLANGSLFNDYFVDVPPNTALSVKAIGGRSISEPCCQLDTTMELFDNETRVASNDDRDHTFASEIVTKAIPSAKRYRVRVSTFGWGGKQGPYTVRADAVTTGDTN